MRNKEILYVFIIVVLVQLYVPVKMILDSENVLEKGIEYKFIIAPIDPEDPFRGKYITLNFKENSFRIQNEADWVKGEKVYLIIIEDKEGFAKIQSVSKKKPLKQKNFVRANVRYISGKGSKKLTIDYPFNRFYMEESKAYDAEILYRKSFQDANKVTYAKVYIKDGNAVLKDVLIDGISIVEIIKANE